MPHYPEQRFSVRQAIIRRQVLLPDNAVGAVTVIEGKRVDVHDVVAQGVMPSAYRILDLKRFFNTRRVEEAESLMLVSIGDVVDQAQVLAGKSPSRGRRLFSPAKGIVAQLHNGRLFLQEMPRIVDLEAGVRGRVSQVFPGRGVMIETTGAQIQGMWGNDQRIIATLRSEPEEGIEHIYTDQLDMRYVGAIVVTRRPITSLTLDVMEEQNFGGIIAPSMDYALHDRALRVDGAIFLLDGFGTAQMSRSTANFFNEFEGQQITLDAHRPTTRENRRPEIVVNIPSNRVNESVLRANILLTLRPGMQVRIMSEPYFGQTGRVVDLPKNPVIMDNGLRIFSAQLELGGGEKVFVPLANLEFTGR
jgi:hypothetical protein